MRKPKATYLVLASNDLVKIGISENPAERIKTIASAEDIEIKKVYHTVPSNYGMMMEIYMHDIFAEWWVKKEWFDIDINIANVVLKNIENYISKQKDYKKTWERYTSIDESNEVTLDLIMGIKYIITAEIKIGDYYNRRALSSNMFTGKALVAERRKEKMKKRLGEREYNNRVKIATDTMNLLCE